MRVTLEQLLNKIGIEATLRPYETIPFDYFNADKGLDVMAEISLSGDAEAVNIEIQQIEHGAGGTMNFRQVMQLQLVREPSAVYMATSLRHNGVVITGKRRNWFDSACRFTKQAIALLRKGTVPDFDALFKSCFDEADGNGAAGGSGGGRALKGDKPMNKPPGGRV